MADGSKAVGAIPQSQEPFDHSSKTAVDASTTSRRPVWEESAESYLLEMNQKSGGRCNLHPTQSCRSEEYRSFLALANVDKPLTAVLEPTLQCYNPTRVTAFCAAMVYTIVSIVRPSVAREAALAFPAM